MHTATEQWAFVCMCVCVFTLDFGRSFAQMHFELNVFPRDGSVAANLINEMLCSWSRQSNHSYKL